MGQDCICYSVSLVALRTRVGRAPQAEPAEREVADRGWGKAIVSVNLKSQVGEMFFGA